MRNLWLAILAVWMVSAEASAQVVENPFQHEGKFWAMWGYNRASYNDSDVHFKGDGFDFTLSDVKAHDVPEAWNPDIYLNIKKLTIPQFNFRAGYFLTEKLSISAGWDHMKYRLARQQLVTIDGYIDPALSEEYGGTYDDDIVRIENSFLRLEHSDGFNFVRIGAEYHQPFWQAKNGKMQVTMVGGAYIGLMFPWTDFMLFGERYRNTVHLSGYGASVMSGFRFEFLKHFFFQARAQYGWSNLTDIKIMDDASARAEQKIVFFERSFTGGAYFNIFRKKD